MKIKPGSRLGSFEIIGLLGVGGMGEVYRARDTRLGREVALKLLPERFHSDPDRVARVAREARILASLNHPHIASIYDIHNSDSLPFLVLELVEGPTLAERLAAGPIPLREALGIALQMSEALEAAHARGIVHRDLKPANVKLTPEGRVKLLDFGLAKALADEVARSDAAELPTMAVDATRAGVIMGTPAYMSPEQAKGSVADRRTDIWAFGSVLFELLAGCRAFGGDTVAETLATVLERDPEWNALPDAAPMAIRQLVRRCLQKDSQRRLHDIADARLEIEEARLTLSGTADMAAPHTTTRPVTAEKSILILPFANLGSDPEDAYFGDGLTDELITDLSRVADLRVVPSAATFRLKNSSKDLGAIGRELKVRYVLEGRVRKAGRSVRITTQLVDVWDDRPVWADKYTGELDDVFELQERVSRAIADALQVQLAPSSRTPRHEAAEAYLKGRHFARQATSAGLQKALEYFQRATAIDPRHASAFAAFAEVYITLTTAWDALPALETMPKAQAAARRALELDPDQADAHVALALVAMFYEWDLRGAERAFKAALRLNPNNANAHRWYAALLIWLDTRGDEALQHVQRAIELDPLDPWTHSQAVWVHNFSRHYDLAIDQAQQIVALAPAYGFAHYTLGCSLANAGRIGEAVQCFERAIEIDGRLSQYVALLGFAYALTKETKAAMDCLAELEALDRTGRNVATWKLHVYAGLRNADRVLDCLDQAIEQRSSSTLFIVNHPYIDFVRRDPRCVALLLKMGLDHLAHYRWEPEWQPSLH